MNGDEITLDEHGNPVKPEVTPEATPAESQEPQEPVEPTEPAESVEPDVVVDPKPEPGADPDPKVEPATDPYQEEFEKLGLANQYPGGVSDVLNRVKDSNRYLDTLEQKTKDLQRELDQSQAAPKPKPVDPDQFREDFETNPINALGNVGLATQREVDDVNQKLQALEQQQAERAFADTVGSHSELKDVAAAFRLGREPVPGTNPIWDEFQREYAMRPGLKNASDDAVLDVLLPIAKARVEARKPPPVKTVPLEQKVGATTTGTGSERQPTGRPDMSGWSTEQVDKWYAERGMMGA